MSRTPTQAQLDRARLLCRVHSERTVAGLLGLHPETLGRARRRGWKAGRKGRELRPMPSDFAIQVRHITLHGLAAHYRTSTRSIARWKRELEARR